MNAGPIIAEWQFAVGFGGYDEYLSTYGGRYFSKVVPEKIVDQALNDYNETFNKKLTKGQFLIPRFTTDKLTYLSDSALEYRTPAGHVGLGSLIVKNAIASMGPDIASSLTTIGLMNITTIHDGVIIQMAARLPKQTDYLRKVILKFSEKCIIHEFSSSVSSDEYNNSKFN